MKTQTNSTLPQLKSFVFDSLVKAASKYDSKDDFMDNFNIEYNDIDYIFTAKLINDFYNTKYSEYKSLFDRDRYPLNSIADERERKTALLDYVLNEFAWINFDDIWQAR